MSVILEWPKSVKIRSKISQFSTFFQNKIIQMKIYMNLSQYKIALNYHTYKVENSIQYHWWEFLLKYRNEKKLNKKNHVF